MFVKQNPDRKKKDFIIGQNVEEFQVNVKYYGLQFTLMHSDVLVKNEVNHIFHEVKQYFHLIFRISSYSL